MNSIKLKARLEGLVDGGASKGEGADGSVHPIRRVVVTDAEMKGPYRSSGPDLIVCYEAGYRCSWQCARGQIAGDVFCDNNLCWSGDHCVDPDLVPGVLFSNHALTARRPGIVDLAPTVLDALGVQANNPAMQGRSLLAHQEAGT